MLHPQREAEGPHLAPRTLPAPDSTVRLTQQRTHPINVAVDLSASAGTGQSATSGRPIDVGWGWAHDKQVEISRERLRGRSGNFTAALNKTHLEQAARNVPFEVAPYSVSIERIGDENSAVWYLWVPMHHLRTNAAGVIPSALQAERYQLDLHHTEHCRFECKRVTAHRAQRVTLWDKGRKPQLFWNATSAGTSQISSTHTSLRFRTALPDQPGVNYLSFYLEQHLDGRKIEIRLICYFGPGLVLEDSVNLTELRQWYQYQLVQDRHFVNGRPYAPTLPADIVVPGQIYQPHVVYRALGSLIEGTVLGSRAVVYALSAGHTHSGGGGGHGHHH